jgi:autotransporter-associated beta strand protein
LSIIQNNTGNTLTIGSIIANNGTSGLSKSGDGTVILTGANTYTGATAIGAGTLQLGNGGTTGTLATTTPIFNNGNLFVNNTSAQTLAAISGTGSVSYTGVAGTLTLSNSNTFSGGFTLNSGSIVMTANGNYTGFGTGVVIINGGTFSNSTNTSQTFANDMVWNAGFRILQASSPIFNGNITLTGNSGITPGSTTRSISATFNGNIGETGGSRSLTFSGVGSIAHTLTFNGQNTFTGNIVGHGSTALVFGGAGYLGGGNYAGAITSGAFTYSSSADQILSGNVSGTTLVKNTSADSTMTLSGTNSFSSTTTVTAGTLLATKAASLSGYTTASRIIFNGGTIGVQVGGAGWTTTQVNTLLTNATKTSGAIGIDTTNGDVTQWAAFTTTNLGATLGLTKLGSNTLILDQTNTYTGATNVTAGTLAVTGTGSINSSSGITIASGAVFRYNSSTALTTAITNNGGTLTGSGTLNVALALNSTNDVLAPGNSPGTMSLGVSQEWNSFTYEWETNNFTGTEAGTDYDLIAITGTLNLTATTVGSYILDLVSLMGDNTLGDVPNFSEINRSWAIVTTTDGISGFDESFWTINADGFTSDPVWTGTWSLGLGNDDKDLMLSYTVIPEPKAAILGALGVVLLFRRRRQG